MSFKKKLFFLKHKKYLDYNNDDYLILDYNNILLNNCNYDYNFDIIKEYIPNIIKLNDEYLIPYNDNYLKFKINNNELYFINTFYCELIYGSQIIKNIINIAKKLNIKHIDLYDEIYIKINEYNINYSTYYILLHGHSWLNKYNFISIDHYDDIKYNKKIRNLKLNLFDFNINKSIYSVIKYINCYFKKNNINNKKILILIKLIDLFKKLLKYNNKLRWINKDL